MAKQKQPPGEPMTLGNMRHLGVHPARCYLLKRCLSPSRSDRRVEVPGRCRIAVVCWQGCLRQVRRARPSHRCEAELEGTIDARKSHGQGLALTSKCWRLNITATRRAPGATSLRSGALTDSPKSLRTWQTFPECSYFPCSLLVLNWLPWPLCH